MRADAARLIRLLDCDPDLHLAELIERTSLAVATAADEAEAMQLLRRMKSEAALLIALCDIGGVWPVMRVTAGLTDLAVASVQSALRYLLRQEAARGRLKPPNPDRPEDGSGLVVLAMGKMGAGELNYSSDIDLIVFFDSSSADACAGHRAAAVFRAGHAGAGAAAAAAHRRRLRVPRRLAAAAGSGLDPGGDVDRSRASLLRAGRAHLGARRDDQGARLRRRRQSRRGAARRHRALRLAQAPGFRGARRRPRHEAADADVSRAERDFRRRPQRQGRARRHPRDRVFRPDPAIDRGRAASGIAGAADAAGAQGAGVEQLDHLCRARRTDRGLRIPAPGRAPAADGRRRADPHASRTGRGGGAFRALLRLRQPRCLRQRPARPSQHRAGPLRKTVRGRSGRHRKAPRVRLRRGAGRQAAARIPCHARLQEAGHGGGDRAAMDVGRRSRAARGGDADRLRRVHSRADRRPCACRTARQRGGRVRSLPAGAAARRPADLAAQPEPRAGRAGGADPWRSTPARRHAGAAAATDGRADRSALLRRDAGPARTVGAADRDPGGRQFLRGIPRSPEIVRPGKPVPDRRAHPVRHRLRAACQRRLRRRRRRHRPYRAWPGHRPVRRPARPHQGAADRDPGDGQARQPRDDGVVRPRPRS